MKNCNVGEFLNDLAKTWDSLSEVDKKVIIDKLVGVKETSAKNGSDSITLSMKVEIENIDEIERVIEDLKNKLKNIPITTLSSDGVKFYSSEDDSYIIYTEDNWNSLSGIRVINTKKGMRAQDDFIEKVADKVIEKLNNKSIKLGTFAPMYVHGIKINHDNKNSTLTSKGFKVE